MPAEEGQRTNCLPLSCPRYASLHGTGSAGDSVRFRVFLDGEPLGAAPGNHVDDQGYGMFTGQRLYQLIRQPQPIADRRFEIEFLDSGVKVFSFTFG